MRPYKKLCPLPQREIFLIYWGGGGFGVKEGGHPELLRRMGVGGKRNMDEGDDLEI